MVLQEYKPSPQLANIIRTYRLVCYNYTADGSLPVKAYPPRPEHCLSFYAKGYETVAYSTSNTITGKLPIVLFGMQNEVTNRYVSNDFLLIQVVFKPGALYRLTGIPSTYLTNEYIDATTIFSTDINDVNDKINECTSFTGMIAVVEAFLVSEVKKRLLQELPLDIVTNQLFATDMLPSIDLLAKNAFVSTRQFERSFKQRMGISPKYYLKVLRFENAFRLKNKSPQLDWLSIAVQCGYYDYQHLVKDYKTLTGYSPAQFHFIDMHGPERLFGEADTY